MTNYTDAGGLEAGQPAASDPDAAVADPSDARSGPPPAGAATADADPAGLTQARDLFSPVLTEDRAAMVAMGSLPREIRASQLCTTELREQLRNAAPPFRPELLPSYRLASGTVLFVPDAAFRADGAWYDLSFRCAVDADALRVVDFAHKVGSAIPRAAWKARGFPDF